MFIKSNQQCRLISDIYFILIIHSYVLKLIVNFNFHYSSSFLHTINLHLKVNSRFTSIVIITLLLFCISSCRTLLDTGYNVQSFFSSPEKVINKIKNPVRDDVRLSALWIGHASFLIQISDKVIMLDPLLTNNVAEVLRRRVEPGLDLSSLKQLDMIIISHSHMDHLSFGSLDEIEELFPGSDLIFPEGVEYYLPDLKFNFHRMKIAGNGDNKYIGETKMIDSVKITTVAAVHWGGRYGIDGKLWMSNGFSGFIIQYKDITVYYTSDTAYDEKLFKFIGDNYNIDLAIVNIIYCDGCSEINSGSSHIYPLGAIKIMNDVKAKFMIPAHWGLFADPEVLYLKLKDMYHTNKEYKNKIKVMKIGEQFVLGK